MSLFPVFVLIYYTLLCISPFVCARVCDFQFVSDDELSIDHSVVALFRVCLIHQEAMSKSIRFYGICLNSPMINFWETSTDAYLKIKIM